VPKATAADKAAHDQEPGTDRQLWAKSDPREGDDMSKWPEPRPIAEAPKLECILAYVPTSSDPHLEGRWLLMAATEDKGKIDGFTVLGANPAADRWFPCSILQPTHFLPLPPAPEVRK